MKILLINDMAVPSGGGEIMAWLLREGLRARGHDARLLASRAGVGPHRTFADYTCYGTTHGWRTPNRLLNVSAVWRLKRVLTEFKPDVVHVGMFFTQLSPLILPCLHNYPSLYHAVWYEAICPTGLKLLPDRTVCTSKPGLVCLRPGSAWLRGAEGCLSLPAWGVLLMQQKLWQQWRHVFKVVVANSDTVRRRLLEHGIEPVEVIWYGVRATSLRPVLRWPPTVSYAGRLSWEKGVDVLVRAFARVVACLPAARLLIAGDGPERASLMSLIAAHDLTAHVTWLGHLTQADMESRLAPAWVHVVPSLFEEPFGLTTIEAMMRGTAVVASQTGGSADIVLAGETGFLVPPDDVNALAMALLRPLQEQELAEALGRAGRTRALTHFSQDVCTERFLRLYQSMMR